MFCFSWVVVLFRSSKVEGKDFDLLKRKCNNSSDKQENESEVKPEVKVNYDNKTEFDSKSCTR